MTNPSEARESENFRHCSSDVMQALCGLKVDSCGQPSARRAQWGASGALIGCRWLQTVDTLPVPPVKIVMTPNIRKGHTTRGNNAVHLQQDQLENHAWAVCRWERRKGNIMAKVPKVVAAMPFLLKTLQQRFQLKTCSPTWNKLTLNTSRGKEASQRILLVTSPRLWYMIHTVVVHLETSSAACANQPTIVANSSKVCTIHLAVESKIRGSNRRNGALSILS